MILRSVVCRARLNQRRRSGVVVAARNGALLQQLLARRGDLLLQIELRLCLRHIQLRLLVILGNLRLGLHVIGSLRGGVLAFVVERLAARSRFSRIARSCPAFTLEPRWT